MKIKIPVDDQFLKWVIDYFDKTHTPDILILAKHIKATRTELFSPFTEEEIIQAIQRIDQTYNAAWISGQVGQALIETIRRK